jgi:deoxyadenosine/deoxycytidine kinase
VSKFIIFVSGLLAAGKTTFSNHLSDELNVLLINKDYVKEILCDTVGFTNRDENLRLSDATHQIMRHITENSMKVGLPIILESNFNPSDAEYFENEIQKYAYKAITVMLTGDKQVLYERFMIRWENRHWGHKSFEPSKELFMNQQEGWERFSVSGEKIVIDTTHFNRVCYEEILTKIRALIA